MDIVLILVTEAVKTLVKELFASFAGYIKSRTKKNTAPTNDRDGSQRR